MTASQINAAIAAGHVVTARAADLVRPRQPNRGATVELTQAWESCGDIRATARGFKGRFRVVDVDGPTSVETRPDSY